MSEINIWTCRIVVDAQSVMPSGFDSVPRNAAETAIERYGIDVLEINSGWGAEPTPEEVREFCGSRTDQNTILRNLTDEEMLMENLKDGV